MSKGNGKANGKYDLSDEERESFVEETHRLIRCADELDDGGNGGDADAAERLRVKAQKLALKVVLSL